jgi:Ca2+-binding EF-hand superfamily protein
MLKQAFRSYDADNDGEIFLDEFIAAVKFINAQKTNV